MSKEIIAPISKHGDEWNLSLNGHAVEVRFSLDRARQDFANEALKRGYDTDAVQQFSASLAIMTQNGEELGGVIPAGVTVDLAAPLRKSRVHLNVYQSHMEKGLEIYLQKERVSTPTKEEIELIIKNHLSKIWIHEREHLLQQFELSPDDFDDHFDAEERKETIRGRWGNICWIATTALVLFLGRELAGPLSGKEIIFLTGWGAIVGMLTSNRLRYRLAFRDYKRSRVEAPAFEQMKTGKCLSGIFDVSLV